MQCIKIGKYGVCFIQESHASKYYETEEHARINAHNKDQY